MANNKESYFSFGSAAFRGLGKGVLNGVVTGLAGGPVGEFLGVAAPVGYGLTAGVSSIAVEAGEAGGRQFLNGWDAATAAVEEAVEETARMNAPADPRALIVQAQQEEAELHARLAYAKTLREGLEAQKPQLPKGDSIIAMVTRLAENGQITDAQLLLEVFGKSKGKK